MMSNFTPIIIYAIQLITLYISTTLILTNNIYIIEWELLSTISIRVKLDLILEWRSMMYSSIIILISANVLKFSKTYINTDPNKTRFTYIIMLFIVSIIILVLIPNIIFLLIGWDGLGITSFILIIHYNNPRSLRAGILTMLTNRLGDTFILISIVVTLNTGDWLTINYPIQLKLNTPQWLGITIACITKRAQIPYSRWLPAAMAAPTPVSALVHSSTLVTAGVFLLYRFNNIINTSPIIQTILITTGISTILMAGIRATYENDIKKIIALSTLRQLGLITTCLGINLPYLAFFHISTHAIFKSLLFISAGCIIFINNHNQDLRIYGQLSNLSPISSSSILIATRALMGIPFIAGYYSKHAIMEWSDRYSINILIFLLINLAIFLTSYYSTRLIISSLINTPRPQSTIFSSYKTNDYNCPIIVISTIRIVSGRIIQWLSPLITNTKISEYIKSMAPLYLIMLSTLIIFLKINKSNNINNLYKKFVSRLRFTIPLSTQFSIQAWISLSINLSKQLDQTWLEKSIRLGPTTLISKSRKTLNSSIFSFSQKTLLNTTSSITAIIGIYFYFNI